MDFAHVLTILLSTLYGDVVDSEDVPSSVLAAALRRFHRRAVMRANSIVVLDGVIQTRNSFLEFMREFNETAARARLKVGCAH